MTRAPDDWDRFCVRHTEPGNLVVHFVSMCCFYGGPVLAVVLWSPWWLLGVPISGPMGAAGHALFRDGTVSLRETTSTPQVLVFVPRMFWRLLRGTYRGDVEAARRRVAAADAPDPPA